MSRVRVLDPQGALPGEATRLDPVGPTGPHERVLALEALVLGPRGRDLARGADDAALARALEDRGGLPAAAGDAALVARADGRRVVLLRGLAALPVWARPTWDPTERAVVHLHGHAVVPDALARWHGPVGGRPLDAVAAALADHVRAVVARLDRDVVVLGTGPLVGVAVDAARGAGHGAVATARTLAGAQALDAAGARVLVDLGPDRASALARLSAAAEGLHGTPAVLLLGALPPVDVAPDGADDDTWALLAGMLAPRVDVVGSADVDSIVAGTGATVVCHGVAHRDRPYAGGSDGWR